ncbi:efflux RND transporter periplasmic adaptor subunit [Paraflavitalea soli]|uniref:Efflux RND transporter periplasmic adaptor subunit n=1 Tax=Paraflavitalea soli TaxID=2315862 RepID=A0A3B7MHS1_9BACT|nr:efflux RND transporter periplasmic adaptor subunit [Paraflavitalea soli]AXY73942.1 efflux RND transporter periplasmic adaptor subunit [Paraflavitalea soli]
MKKNQLLLLAAAILILYSCHDEDKAKKAFEVADVIPVKTSAVSALALPQKISATGLVSTENEAKYSFKIGGVISSVLIEEGQFFRKGQLLATLNSTEIAAGVSQSSLNVEKAQRDHDRAVNLYKDSVFTLEQLQNTKTALDIAQKAKEAVSFNEHYSKIYAASDGFVSQKIANEGEVIGPGMPVLAINETQRNNNYILRVGVTDKEWAMINLGQTSTVTLDGYEDKQIEAFVFRKSQVADRTLGSFQVELKLKLKDIKPAVGMFGKAEISTSQNENVKVVPYGSLVEADGDKAFVFTPDGANKVRKIPVTISRVDNQQVYLKGGLDGVEEIVISNSAYLNEKSTIKIIR